MLMKVPSNLNMVKFEVIEDIKNEMFSDNAGSSNLPKVVQYLVIAMVLPFIFT
jgi:hypothetical protein